MITSKFKVQSSKFKLQGLLVWLLLGAVVLAQDKVPSGAALLKKVDDNAYARSRVAVSEMTIHAGRATRTMISKSWIQGDKQSFTEFLYPERDAGTKMLRLGDELWTYTPSTDRTIRISGSMLRQSVMGSDLSYEDMMEDRTLEDMYTAEVTGEDTLLDRPCWVLTLTADTDDVAYHSRKIWVDRATYIILKEERYGLSGTLLKTMDVDSIARISGRWVQVRARFKDALKVGEGTAFAVDSTQFNVDIPDYMFSKAALKE
jgi:outer membrane lipoprotein-sorting protein